jgi:hypothetical protein
MSTTPIPDATILAAIDRAALHRGRPGVPIWMILEHLGLRRRAPRVRTQIRTLTDAGALATSRAHGVELWSLTAAGRRQLRRAGSVELPESPQHQAWRAARVLAEQEIERFRSAMADVLAEAMALLDGSGSSDGWFEMADRPRRAAWRLGSATYCLLQWSEPTDDRTDTDDYSMPGDVLLSDDERARHRHRRSGRRNTNLWRDSE